MRNPEEKSREGEAASGLQRGPLKMLPNIPISWLLLNYMTQVSSKVEGRMGVLSHLRPGL